MARWGGWERADSGSQAGNAVVLASPLPAPLSCVVTTATAFLAIDLPKCFSPQMVPPCPDQFKRQESTTRAHNLFEEIPSGSNI